MITIEPKIKIYDDEGNLSKAYDKAVDKMIDKTYDIDLEQFDFDEVANGKSKELDNLVVKLCKESGLGSKDIYTMLLDRFEAEYDVPVDFIVYLGKDWEDDFEESKKSARNQSKKFFYYPCYVSDDRDEEGYIDYHGHLTSDISKAPLFETEQELGKWFNKLNWYKWYSDYEMRTEGMYVDEKDYEDYNIIKESLKFAKKSIKESKESARKSLKEGLMDIRDKIQDYVNVNEFDITIQTTPKKELIIVFGGTSNVNKIYDALVKELKSRGADLSTIDIKKKNDVVIATWNLNFVSSGMYDDMIADGTIDLIDNLSEVVNLHLIESKTSSRKSIKESADDNWYKLKILNEMLNAMVKDEYNIPKVGIYGVTKNINLDEGAIKALIKYYK